MHEIYHLLKVHERKCIFISILSLIALVIIHVLVSTIHVNVGSPIFTMLSTISFALVTLLSLLVITKGMVPIVINFLGIVLIYGSIVVPAFERAMLGAVYYKAAIGNITETSLYSGSHGLLALGIFMLAMSVIIGYKPSILYTRNRPQPMEKFWSKYPIWKKELQWIGIRNGSLIRLTSLMDEKEKYLLWRYEYVLTSINETLFLVPVNSFVPSKSLIMRERSSGKIIGVDRYMGLFS
jgi:hypothetical protein